MQRGLAILCLILSASVAAARGQSTQPATAPAADAQVDQNLTLLTGNNTLEARRIGARGLLTSNGDRALSKVTDMLRRAEDPMAQLAVCQEVAALDTPPGTLVDPILALLVSPRDDVAAAAGLAVGRFPRGEVIPRLEKAAARRGSANGGRRAAVAALGRLGDSPAAVDALIKLLEDAEPDLREAAMDALERAAGMRHADAADARKWWTENKSKDQTTWLRERDARREAALRSQETRIGELAHRLVELSRADYLRRDESEKVTRLLALLSDTEPALRGLGLDLTNALITDRKPVPPEVGQRVRAMLADPAPDLRRAAVAIIGDLREPKDATALLDALKRESVIRVRAAILRALGRIGDAAVLPILEKALEDRARDVVAEAVTAIGYVGERANANGNGPAIRRDAAAVVLPRFRQLAPTDPLLLVAFLDAMARLGAPRFDPVFAQYMQTGQSPEVRQAALRGAAARNESALADQIAAALSDELPAIRLAAAGALGRCGRGDAHLEALLQRVEGAAESDGAVRTAAWEAFVRVWQGRSLNDRLNWADRLSAAADPAAAARRVTVLTTLDRELTQAQAAASARLRVIEPLVDALMLTGQTDQAAALCQNAINLVTDPLPGPLAARAVRAMVRAEKFEAAVALLTRVAAHPGPPSASAPRSVLSVAVDEARRFIQQHRTDAATEFIHQTQAALTGRMPANWDAELNAFRRELAAVQSSAPTSSSAPTPGA